MTESTNFASLKSTIHQIAEENVNRVLDGQSYKGDQIKSWSEDIIRGILSKLSAEQFQPFKYLANCLVLSKRSNGVHTVTMSLWDPQNDGSDTLQWSNDSMQCIVTVWGLKY